MNVGPIVVDTSAIVAMHNEEDDADAYWHRLEEAGDVVLPASCYLEAVMVLNGDPHARAWLDRIIFDYRIALAPIGDVEARLAADAFERYGRGRHKARLNFGDCLSYAAAKALDASLLFKGDDFRHTDVKRAA